MVFSSIPFVFYFLPVFLAVYYLVPPKCKNLTLLVFSLVFYAWGEPVYISLLIVSSLVDYCNGLMMERFDQNSKRRRLFLIVSVVMNLGLLGVFKYGNLMVSTFGSIFGGSVEPLDLPLPIGISFFTFQTMSYSIDVYRRKVKTEHNFIDYMTYVSMFPQLVAGPIVRYDDIQRELGNRKVTFDDFCDGMLRFGIGLMKKVLIANQVGSLFDESLSSLDSLSMLGSWIGILAFTLQIYFDFSGYSDMAIGMGRMMGFRYPENFNYPYISRSITEFWKRWHMTLSGWFRLYVYIPLGGNRVGTGRHIFNIALVWALTGFWHGASWNFMLWGLYFAVLLLIEKYLIGEKIHRIPNAIRLIVTFVLIMFSWVIFQVGDISGIVTYYKTMLWGNGNGVIDGQCLYNLQNYGFILAVGMIGATPLVKACAERVMGAGITERKWVKAAVGVVYLTLIVVAFSFLVRDTYNPFLYFRF